MSVIGKESPHLDRKVRAARTAAYGTAFIILSYRFTARSPTLILRLVVNWGLSKHSNLWFSTLADFCSGLQLAPIFKEWKLYLCLTKCTFSMRFEPLAQPVCLKLDNLIWHTNFRFCLGGGKVPRGPCRRCKPVDLCTCFRPHILKID